MIVHRLARPMIAAIFITSGIDTLRNPEKKLPAAKSFLDSAVEKLGDSLPAKVPTDPVTLIRLDAAVKVGAGVLLAIGRFPRLSALVLAGNLVPTTLAAHSYWEHEDPAQRAGQRIQFLKNLAMAGGLLIAATSGGRKKKSGD
jgi:putative oxidoreductase